MNKENKKVILTVEEIEKIASNIGVIRDDIELMYKAIDFIPDTNNERVQQEPLYMYGVAYSLSNSLFYKLQHIDKELDYYARLLISVADAKEINMYREINDKTKIVNRNA